MSATEEAVKVLGLSEFFVGLILIPIIGNAAENSSAIIMALRNRMDLALNIAIGSSIQVALLIAPLLVLLGMALHQPMDLAFTTMEVASIALAVGSVIRDQGRGNELARRSLSASRVRGTRSRVLFLLTEQNHQQPEANDLQQPNAIRFSPDGGSMPAHVSAWIEAQEASVVTIGSGDELMSIGLRARPRFVVFDARRDAAPVLAALHRVKKDSYTAVVPCVVLSAKKSEALVGGLRRRCRRSNSRRDAVAKKPSDDWMRC